MHALSFLSNTNSLLLLILLSSVATSAPAPHQRQHQNRPAKTGKAIYFLTNDAANAVVALPIARDGTLAAGTVTKTGGAGSNSVDAMNKPAAPDALIGQSALTVVGNTIFAVNAGSNTISMLTISPSDPTCLTLVGQPAAIPGDFPNTVAASAKNKLVCVGTTGAKSGISCATFSQRGVGKMDALRPFDLGQTTPPVGPLNSVSQTFFSADESRLFTTVKGDPPANKTGFLSVFPVFERPGNGRDGAARLSTQETRSSPNGTAVLFGSALIPGKPDAIFATDASFGAAVLSLDGKARASLVGKQAVDGQAATCWATVSDATKTAFVTDVARNRIVEMSLEDASIVSILDLSSENSDGGLIDLRAAGNFVYALAPGNGSSEAAVTVVDVSGGPGKMRQAQHFGLGKMAGKNAQGMAVLV